MTKNISDSIDTAQIDTLQSLNIKENNLLEKPIGCGETINFFVMALSFLKFFVKKSHRAAFEEAIQPIFHSISGSSREYINYGALLVAKRLPSNILIQLRNLHLVPNSIEMDKFERMNIRVIDDESPPTVENLSLLTDAFFKKELLVAVVNQFYTDKNIKEKYYHKLLAFIKLIYSLCFLTSHSYNMFTHLSTIDSKLFSDYFLLLNSDVNAIKLSLTLMLKKKLETDNLIAYVSQLLETAFALSNLNLFIRNAKMGFVDSEKEQFNKKLHESMGSVRKAQDLLEAKDSQLADLTTACNELLQQNSMLLDLRTVGEGTSERESASTPLRPIRTGHLTHYTLNYDEGRDTVTPQRQMPEEQDIPKSREALNQDTPDTKEHDYLNSRKTLCFFSPPGKSGATRSQLQTDVQEDSPKQTIEQSLDIITSSQPQTDSQVDVPKQTIEQSLDIIKQLIIINVTQNAFTFGWLGSRCSIEITDNEQKNKYTVTRGIEKIYTLLLNSKITNQVKLEEIAKILYERNKPGKFDHWLNPCYRNEATIKFYNRLLNVIKRCDGFIIDTNCSVDSTPNALRNG